MKKITPADYRSMPWKNGLGTTIEMAVFPEHAFLDDFEWRVSRAAVVSDGRFSGFAGIDRSLALLQGQGMRLRIDSTQQQVDAGNNIAVFPGDAATHAELMDGPITDFNLMSRRSSCTHQLTHWTGQAIRELPGEAVLLYCAQGSGTLSTEQGELELRADETVQFAPTDPVCSYRLAAGTDSRFYCAQIFRNKP